MVQRYIVARPFQSHEGQHNAGEPAPASAAEWFSIRDLVGLGWLYPVVDNKVDYAALPDHIFNAVRTRQEIEGLIKLGDNPSPFEWDKPPVLIEAEKERDIELHSHEVQQGKLHERAVEHQEKAVENAIDPHPVQVPYKIPAVDAMQEFARNQAEIKDDAMGPDVKLSNEAEHHEIRSHLGHPQINEGAAEQEAKKSEQPAPEADPQGLSPENPSGEKTGETSSVTKKVNKRK